MMMVRCFNLLLYEIILGICLLSWTSADDLLVYTVATNKTDGFNDFMRSASYYNIEVKVLGFGEQWKGGSTKSYGGGHKINLLRNALEPYQSERRLMLFTDGYDVLFLSPTSEIVRKFKSTNAGILFAAETYCWPDVSLVQEYPYADGYRFVNSGGFIGYTDLVYELVTSRKVKDVEDDQLFYTHAYLNSTLRKNFNIKLDHKAEIFQNLNGASDDVKLDILEDGGKLTNTKYSTEPCILHGNGYSKYVHFRSLSNYLAGNWSPKDGCRGCSFDVIDLRSLPVRQYPIVLVSIFIEKPSPFLSNFLLRISQQSYPKKRIHLLFRNNVLYHKADVAKFISEHETKYRSIKLIPSENDVDTISARTLAMDYCVQKNCDVYMYIESEAHLDDPETLFSLVQQNRSIIAPLLYRPYKAWSNFWGALDKDGYYKRSFDYMDIVKREKRALWNVPFISSCYLIKGHILKTSELKPSYSYNNLDYDMAFCTTIRLKQLYMYVDNRKEFGHLVDLDNFDTSRTNPEMYELLSNRWDWEQKYIHEHYNKNFEPENVPEQPCPDVYWFPIVSPDFCKELIEIVEGYGRWSDGSHNDTRLKTGYEAVPTRDIHMNQVGLDELWLEFLKIYVSPLQELVFVGYVHDRPRSLMNFVVRYRPDEQPSLRPHHDSSTYTINIALNKPGVDYQGGGCRFIRYDCTVADMRLGWTLLHPGRLTHYHEGLPVTNGTRYIMISFVDP